MIHFHYSTILKIKSIQFLFQGFKKSFKKMSANDLKILNSASKKKQSPKAMVISCCDSRVNVEKIFNSKHGELFIHKNIANLIPGSKNKDLNCSAGAALEYGVVILKVPTIIILGHTNCGGIKAYSESFLGLDKSSPKLPLVKKWLKVLKPCFSKKINIKDIKSAVKYLEKAALMESLKNLRTYSFIRDGLKNKKLTVMACLFDIKSGELFYLDEETNEFNQINSDK